MKNILNEELDTMKYLFGYKKGVVISEQENPLQSPEQENPLQSHRTSCGQKLIGKEFTFSDARGMRKENITIAITEITYENAKTGNMFQNKQNRAARAGADIAVINGKSLGEGNDTYTFKFKCSNEGTFSLTATSSVAPGVKKGDVYDSPRLYNILSKSMQLCGSNSGQYYCMV